MKIAFFTASINIGGIERVFISYATGLLNLGYDVHYITCWEDGDFSNKIPSGIKTHGLGNIRLRYSILGLKRILNDIRPDVIITGNDSTFVVYLAILLSANLKTKIITSLHSYYTNSETLFYTKPIIKYVFPRCNKIIAVSQGIADMLASDFNLKYPKVEVVNNPNNIDQIIKDSTAVELDYKYSKYLLFVGRMTPVKNLFFLIDAFVKFHAVQPDYLLLMIGDGYSRKDIEKYVVSQNAESFIKFLGVKPNPYPYIKNASALILTSTSEAFPTVLIEAMALGVTCVSTPTKGAVEILENGGLGYISTSFSDSTEFSRLLSKAVQYPLISGILLDNVNSKYGIESKTKKLSSIIQSLYI